MGDKFLMQLVRELNREGAPLDLLFAKTKGLLCDERLEDALGTEILKWQSYQFSQQ